MTNLEKLETYDPALIDSFLKKGKSDAIDSEMQLYIEQLQFAAEVNHHFPSPSTAAKRLAERVWATQKIKMSARLARERIADAINYFHVDMAVSQKVWDMRTADRLDDMSHLMLADDKLDQAAKWTEKANNLRKRANDAINTEDLKAPVFLFSDKISLADMGFEKENLKAIAKKDNDGFYLNLINTLDIDQHDKKRLMQDANISDTEFEELEDD